MQIVKDTLEISLSLEDLSYIAEAGETIDINDRLMIEAKKPFDLAQGPLIHAKLLRIEERKHILFLAIHHIIFDGWSKGVFLQELMALYGVYSTGQPSPLQPLPIQYADYAIWQRQQLQSEKLQTHLDYWQQKLGMSPPVLTIPTDHPRPTVQTFHGSEQSILLSKSLLSTLKMLSMREGKTLFMTLLAAFQALLARYSGQEDIIIGTRVAGRNQRETEGLIGCFINALVINTSLDGNPTFQDMMKRVGEVALEAFSHQELPFEKLVEKLQIKRDPTLHPLFQVMFVLQTAPNPTFHLPDLTITSLEIERDIARYDLDFSLIEDESGGLLCSMMYNTQLFEQETIQRLLKHFQTLLEAVSSNPTLRLWDLPLLTPREQQQLLDWHGTIVAYPDDERLSTLFEQKAAQIPDAPAVIYEGECLTYQELNKAANQLAHYLLIEQGIGPEMFVGVCVERSIQTLISLLAILKIGGIYVPLDPTYPSAYLAAMLRDVKIATVLTKQQYAQQLLFANTSIICLDSEWQAISRYGAHNPHNPTVLDNAVYLMFTSGSTGQPKGVIVPQRQVINRLNWMWRVYPFANNEVACQRTTINFTPSLCELLGPLLYGVPTVIIPDMVVKDPLLLVPVLARQKVTRIVVVPSLLQAILNSNLDLQAQLPLLKYWHVGGELLSRALAQHFHDRLPHAILINQYGATEMSDVAYCDTWEKYPHLLNVPSGYPIDNTHIYLLDRHLCMTPIGVPGEVYIGGVGVPRGYINRPDLTAERFIPDPFSSTPGSRLYNMGDIARYLPDGSIELLGRRDQQAKFHGYRVELAGIEAILNQHPQVQQAIVLLQDVKGEQLIAYVLPIGDEHPSPAHLRSYLSEVLPGYMIPTKFVMIDALPRLQNGKVDRNSLTSLPVLPDHIETTYTAPQTDLEQTIARIWREVLQVEEVSIHSNFFDLGGHSLLGLEVRNRLQEILQREILLIELFEHTTISALAKYLSQQTHDNQEALEHIPELVKEQRTFRKRRKQFKQRISEEK